MNSLEILGILSALMALVAFVGNESGTMRARSFWYDILNLVSSLGLIAYALSVNAIPFIITNSVWSAVSAFDLLRNLRQRRFRRM